MKAKAKKKVKKVVERPSRRMVETLIKSLRQGTGYGNWGWEWDGLENEREELKDQLLSHPRLKEIEKKQAAIISRVQKERIGVNAAVDKINRLYLANGVTPKVLKDLNDLISKMR